MSPNNDRTWITRLLSLGLRHEQMGRALNQSGSLQQEAYVRQLLKETRQKRLDSFTAIDDITFIILDTETTGFNPNEDAIFSFSATKTLRGVGHDSFTTLINPEREIPEAVLTLTQIDVQMLQKVPTMKEQIQTLLNFLNNGVLVGYHLGHDLAFLNAYLRKTNQGRLPHQSFELRQLMERTYKKSLPTLDHALEFLEIPCDNRHTAEGDVKAMVKLWEQLYEQFKQFDLNTLYDLYAFVGS